MTPEVQKEQLGLGLEGVVAQTGDKQTGKPLHLVGLEQRPVCLGPINRQDTIKQSSHYFLAFLCHYLKGKNNVTPSL